MTAKIGYQINHKSLSLDESSNTQEQHKKPSKKYVNIEKFS
jgi:hypothetical protein